MKSENKKKSTIYLIIGAITLIMATLGATYAYFTAQGGSAVNTNVNVTTNTTDNLSFQVGNAISLTANQEDFGSGDGNKTGSTTASATLTANNATNNATRSYYLYLNINSNNFEYTTDERTAELILAITDPNDAPVTSLAGYEYVKVGDVSGFDITTTNGLITLADNYEITSTGTFTQEWNVTITFVNLNSDQNANAGKNFSAELIIQEDSFSLGNFAEYITNHVYTGVDGVNGLYYHDGEGSYTNADQEAGDNSYRYAGANPNNYVCFGATGQDCQNADNQYRIIGVFDNEIKLIKATYYGVYAWDADNVSTWDADTKPDIYTTLNETYYGTLTSEWQGLIDQNHTWQVGGMTSSNGMSVAKTVYDYEVGTNQTGYEQPMAIGLMYVSDYGYGAAPSKWTTSLGTWDYGTDNWLYLGTHEWLISLLTDGSNLVTFYSSSDRGGGVWYNYAHGTLMVRPVFYLESNVSLASGNGTLENPYRLAV